MDCRAKVVKKEGDRALVRVARVNCAKCGGCGLLARNRDHSMEFDALDRLGTSEGDEVILNVPSRRLGISYLVVFGMPVLAMAAAYFALAGIFAAAGGGGGQAAGVIAAAVAGMAAFWLGVRVADRMGLSPVITAIIASGDEGGLCDDGEEGFEGKVL